MSDNKTLIISLGKTVILAAQRRFETEVLDNDEHIPNLKTIIGAFAEFAASELDETSSESVEGTLCEYGRDLFIQFWLKLADEADDADSLDAEETAARKTFDRIYKKPVAP